MSTDSAPVKRSYRGIRTYLVFPLLLIFFAVPYLIDLAYCNEIYHTDVSQSALIDGESVDPCDDETSWTSPHYLRTTAIHDFPLSNLLNRPFSSEKRDSIPIPVYLISRPPPIS